MKVIFLNGNKVRIPREKNTKYYKEKIVKGRAQAMEQVQKIYIFRGNGTKGGLLKGGTKQV